MGQLRGIVESERRADAVKGHFSTASRRWCSGATIAAATRKRHTLGETAGVSSIYGLFEEHDTSQNDAL